MIQNKKQSTEYNQTQNNLYSYAIPKFLRTSGFKWIDPKNFDLNTYTSYSVLEVNIGYSKDLPELYNDYLCLQIKLKSKKKCCQYSCQKSLNCC